MTAAPAKRVPGLPSNPAEQRWLVFVHQLPAHPSNGRVKTWRRLQQVGAVPVKNAVYVLPNTAQAREDFEWLRAEVVALGGQANIFEASSISGVEERQIIANFRKARAEDFSRLNEDIKAMRPTARASFRSDEVLKKTRVLRERFEELRRIDFFGAPGGRKAASALSDLGSGARRPPRAPARMKAAVPERVDRRQYQRRTWMTRPRPGVDRFSSAWLIRRYIDPSATFTFGTSPETHPDAVPFDMYQSGGFKHEGNLCTFEVLQERFGITDNAVRQIGEIVHDLDLKDDRFKHAQTATIGALVEGFRAAHADDAALLQQGIALFEALYQSLQPVKRGGRPKIC